MNISYDYYRIFYYVAKYQSFSGAARALMNNQPNITRTMKRLESELGCKLFIRQKHGMQLTPEGKKLYEHISIAFDHITAGEQEISKEQSLKSGTVAIAASEIALHCCLLPVLKEFHDTYPKVRIRVSNHTSPQAVELLRNGLADFAVVTTPLGSAKSFHTTILKDIQEVPVCSRAFSVPADSTLTLKELFQFPIIGLENGTNSRAFYSTFFAESGFSFTPDIEAATADQILPLVRSNLGIGFVPLDFLTQDGHTGDLMVLKLEKAVPKRQICLLTQKDANLNVTARELIKMLKKTSAPHKMVRRNKEPA